MLYQLIGNKSLLQVLYFLLVNREAYPSQVCRQLGGSFTPIQRAFFKLEKDKIVVLKQKGKTHLFSFNEGYPLLNELEQLLRKGFSLLSSKEQRDYYDLMPIRKRRLLSPGEEYSIVKTLWKTLPKVKQFTFRAKEPGVKETRHGKGEVITEQTDHQIIYKLQGSWNVEGGVAVRFSNSFSWSFSDNKRGVVLEHLRHGTGSPVYLFSLIPSSFSQLMSKNENSAAGEVCFGSLDFDDHFVQLVCKQVSGESQEDTSYMFI